VIPWTGMAETARLRKRAPRIASIACGVIFVVVGLVTLVQMVAWYGQPVAGVLLDAAGHVSTSVKRDEAHRIGLTFPDRMVTIDGQPLHGSRPPGLVWDMGVIAAHARGESEVTAVVEAADGQRREVSFRITRLDPTVWWRFAIVWAAGILWGLVTLFVLEAGGHTGIGRTSAKLALLMSIFLLTMVDQHSTRRLVPLFALTFGGMGPAFVAFALRVPDDARVLARLPRLERATEVAGLALGVGLIASMWSGWSSTVPQLVTSWVFAAGMAFFVVVFAARFVAARGARRRTMRIMAIGTVPSVALVAAHLATSVIPSVPPLVSRLGENAVPVAAVIFPASLAYSFWRHDLYGAQRLLSRAASLLALATGVCLLATGVAGALARWVEIPTRSAVVVGLVASTLAAAGLLVALRVSERVWFRARLAYKPSVARLSAELTTLTSPASVAAAVETTVSRWLAASRVKLRLAGEDAPLDADGGPRFDLPVVFRGRALADLHVARAPGDPPFTDEDADLLSTIADQSTLALAHADAYQALERLRREQTSALRAERAALLKTVAAEIAHEIRYPINFFRTVLAGRATLAPEDIEIGRLEVARLERIVADLRRVEVMPLQLRAVRLVDVCRRAELVVADALAGRSIEVAVPDDLRVRCDPDQVTQILINLLANAIEADAATLGIAWRAPALEVWDTGPGFAGRPEDLFTPWFTTRERGSGLGLAICHRLARAHGFTIAAAREGDRTVFRLRIPPTSLVTEPT
jgi:signal transduction histidine kinase